MKEKNKKAGKAMISSQSLQFFRDIMENEFHIILEPYDARKRPAGKTQLPFSEAAVGGSVIVVGDETDVSGYLVSREPLAQEVEHAACMFLRAMLHQEQQALRMERVFREESILVTRMVSEDARINHHDIVAFGTDLGYKLEHPMAMIVASLEASCNHCMNMNLGYESATNDAKNSIIQQLKEHACMNKQDIVAFVQNNYLVVLKAIEDSRDRETLYRVMDKVAQAISEVLNSYRLFRCYVAPPEIIESFDLACRAYQDALDCISYAQRINLDHSVIAHDDVLYYLFVSRLPDKIRVESVDPIVRFLLSQNPEMVQSLIQCFDAYSNNGLNIATTAEVVYMHRNTVKKKLEKLYQITGFDPAGDFRDIMMNRLILEQYLVESRGLWP